MDNNNFGLKELYEATLKLTYPMEIGGVSYESGEIIAFFDKISLAVIEDEKSVKSAHGGFNDRGLVFWETEKQLDLVFSQGVFSKTQFGLLLNSNMLTTKNTKILIPKRETKESDAEGKFCFSKEPVGTFFIYDSSGNKITTYTKIDATTYSISKQYEEIILDYYFYYSDNTTEYIIGKQLINGFLKFEGKTRVKDDKTGTTCTGIITIPKLKLMSDLSMRLGSEAKPLVGKFECIGLPAGGRENQRVMSIRLLNDDIDSDI